ncbi:uncharacterized protein DUF4334 [Agrobacterium vitis]|nr:uncharacterized protein DUF4334 [Agrobacterium vitis]
MIADIISKKAASSEAVLQCFDSLPTADIDFMLGRWSGFEIRTGHPLDGLLEPTGWYGKLFEDKDCVHPLLFYTRSKDSLYAVDPTLVPLTAPFPRSSALGVMMALAKPFVQTKSSKARLRMIEFRGRATATMAYDSKPIFDHFARIDDRRVLGIMDLKGVPGPYAFCLERDEKPIKIRL